MGVGGFLPSLSVFPNNGYGGRERISRLFIYFPSPINTMFTIPHLKNLAFFRISRKLSQTQHTRMPMSLSSDSPPDIVSS